MEKYGIIYLIRNKVNGKMYIGQTDNKYGFKGRYSHGHGEGATRCYLHHLYNKENNRDYNKHLLSSFEKYGVENFEVDEEFDIAYSKEELDKLECLYINIYNLRNRAYGYNNKSGGSHGKHSEESKKKMSDKAKLRTGKKNAFFGKHHSDETKKKLSEINKINNKGENNPFFGKHHTEEAKQKMSEAHKGKKLSEEHKQKMSEARKGEKHPNYGKHLPEETKKKMSEKAKGRYVGEKSPRAKAVYCYELNEIRLCSKDWERELNLSNGKVATVCRGERKSHKGYHFRWATKEEIEEYLKQQNKDNNDVA